jgi:hypothetical protein
MSKLRPAILTTISTMALAGCIAAGGGSGDAGTEGGSGCSIFGCGDSGASSSGSSGSGGGSGGSSGSSSSSSGGGSSGSSGSGGSSIVGEWQFLLDAGGSVEVFFNANGTCGIFGTSAGKALCENCTYTSNGSLITIKILLDGGASETTTDTVTVSGNTLTIGALDGGASASYSRVNSSSTNTCP